MTDEARKAAIINLERELRDFEQQPPGLLNMALCAMLIIAILIAFIPLIALAAATHGIRKAMENRT